LTIQSSNALGSAAGGIGGGNDTIVSGNALLNVQGGVLTVPEGLTLGSNSPNSSGTLQNLAGTNLWTGGIVLAFNSSLAVASGTNFTIATGGVNLITNTLTANILGTAAINSVISSLGTPTTSLNKLGSGTLTLAGA